MHAPGPDFRFPSLAEKLDPQQTALLIVDVQNDFCHPQGFYPGVPEFSGTQLALIERMRAPLVALLAAARDADCLRVLIRGIYDPVYVAAPFAEKMHARGALGHACMEGTWGADYWEPIRLERGPREVEVIKHRNSAFHGTNLAVILRANAIKTVVVTGVATSGCVDSTARAAMFEDFWVVVPADATADYVEERQRVHLAKLASGFASVATTAEVVRAWQR
ncbi:MAG: cysteine hydrolase family protein [Burkholderiales bacterium]